MIEYDGFHKVKKFESEVKGRKVIREKLLIKDAVAAVVTDSAGRVALVFQYRPCIGKYLYELPAGLIDKEGLSHQEILFEELEEECELDTSLTEIEYEMAHYYMLAGSSDSMLTIYKVHYDGIGENKRVADNDVEEVRWFELSSIKNLLQLNLIKDSKTLIGLNKLLSIKKEGV